MNERFSLPMNAVFALGICFHFTKVHTAAQTLRQAGVKWRINSTKTQLTQADRLKVNDVYSY